MRTGDVDIVIIPDWPKPVSDHWLARWERNLRTAQRIAVGDELVPDRASRVARVVEAVDRAQRPVVLIAHGLGVATTAYAAGALDPSRVIGALLVAPSDVDHAADWPAMEGANWTHLTASFVPMPVAPLPFRSRLIASSNDAYCSVDRANVFGTAWGAQATILANAGHITAADGYGPWPDGLLTLGLFLRSLGAP